MAGKYSLREAYELFVTLSLFLPVNCVLILLASSLFVAGAPFAAGIGFLTLSPLMAFIYIADRWSISEEDRINDPHRTALVEKYRTELLGLAILSILLFEISLIVPALSRGLTGVGYVALGHVPIVVLSLYDRLKSLPIPADSTAVGFAWSFEIAYIFSVVAPQTATPVETVTLLVAWFLIVFAGVEARNIGDVEGDRKTGKVTLTVMLGQRAVRRLTVGLKATGVLLLSVLSASPLVFGFLVVHLSSLRFYRGLEQSCQSGSGQSRQPSTVASSTPET